MNLLIDTHTLLWHAWGDPRMSSTATTLLVDPANDLFHAMPERRPIGIVAGHPGLLSVRARGQIVEHARDVVTRGATQVEPAHTGWKSSPDVSFG